MKQKYYYYVLVCTTHGQGRFVTEVEHSSKLAFWRKNEKPKAMTKTNAEDLAYCLTLNFYPAYVVKSYHEITNHYFYKEN